MARERRWPCAVLLALGVTALAAGRARALCPHAVLDRRAFARPRECHAAPGRGPRRRSRRGSPRARSRRSRSSPRAARCSRPPCATSCGRRPARGRAAAGRAGRTRARAAGTAGAAVRGWLAARGGGLCARRRCGSTLRRAAFGVALAGGALVAMTSIGAPWCSRPRHQPRRCRGRDDRSAFLSDLRCGERPPGRWGSSPRPCRAWTAGAHGATTHARLTPRGGAARAGSRDGAGRARRALRGAPRCRSRSRGRAAGCRRSAGRPRSPPGRAVVIR